MEGDSDDLVMAPEVQGHWYPEFEEALAAEQDQPDRAIQLYRELIMLKALPPQFLAEQEDAGEKLGKLKEVAVTNLAQLLSRERRWDELMQLLVYLRPYFATISKARTARLIKTIIDLVADAGEEANLPAQLRLVQDVVQWCVREKRSLLKQRLQARLAELLFQSGSYKESLALIAKLIKEVKLVDDRLLLVEIHLTEARVHLRLQNLPKAKGAMTSARSAANAVYCPPNLQANIDLLAGILSARELDFKTSFSYFYEAFEGFNSIDRRPEAIRGMKYMLLTKIMSEKVEDVYGIINGKSGLKYAGRDVEAMRFLADAYRSRSLERFNEVYERYSTELAEDAVIASHLDTLRAGLLQRNLNRVVEPFSRVEISHVARLMNMEHEVVEAKLSEMILDGKLNGILDQGENVLILFDGETSDPRYAPEPVLEQSMAVLQELDGVVDRLSVKVQRLLR